MHSAAVSGYVPYGDSEELIESSDGLWVAGKAEPRIDITTIVQDAHDNYSFVGEYYMPTAGEINYYIDETKVHTIDQSPILQEGPSVGIDINEFIPVPNPEHVYHIRVEVNATGFAPCSDSIYIQF
jgi:hypothetical protein